MFVVGAHEPLDEVGTSCVLRLQVADLLDFHSSLMLGLTLVEQTQCSAVPGQFQAILSKVRIPGIVVQLVDFFIDCYKAFLRTFVDHSWQVLTPEGHEMWLEGAIFEQQLFRKFRRVVPDAHVGIKSLTKI